jgi:hypothetical protein
MMTPSDSSPQAHVFNLLAGDYMITREEFLGRFHVLDYPSKFDPHMFFSFIDWAGNDVRKIFDARNDTYEPMSLIMKTSWVLLSDV